MARMKLILYRNNKIIKVVNVGLNDDINELVNKLIKEYNPDRVEAIL